MTYKGSETRIKMKKLFWIVGVICVLVITYMSGKILWQVDKLLSVAVVLTQVLYHVDTFRRGVLK